MKFFVFSFRSLKKRLIITQKPCMGMQGSDDIITYCLGLTTHFFFMFFQLGAQGIDALIDRFFECICLFFSE